MITVRFAAFSGFAASIMMLLTECEKKLMAHGYLCQVCGHIMSYALNKRCIMCKGKSLEFCRDMRSESVIDSSFAIKRRHKPVAPKFAILNVALMVTVISAVGAWISVEVGRFLTPASVKVELAGKNKPGL